MYKQLKSKTIIGTWSLSGDYGHVNKLEIYKTLEYAIKNNKGNTHPRISPNTSFLVS